MSLRGPTLEQPVSLSAILARGLANDRDAPALITHDTRWTYAALDAAADRLAAHYLGMGLQAGDRVASFLPNSPEMFVHYLACLRAGLVATPLNYRYATPEIDHALDTAGVAALVAAGERRADLAGSAVASRLPRGIIWHGDTAGDAPSLQQLIDRPATCELPPPAPDAPALIFFTSGSTGMPKGVTHTHASFGWLLASCAAAFEHEPGEVILPATSASHVAAIMFTLAALSVGARSIVAPRFDGDVLLPLLREERPAVLIMLPAALMALVRDHGARGEDFTSVRVCVCGGDKVSAELEREYERLTGRMIDEGYGMTETGMATRNPIAGPIRIGSVGTIAPGFEVALRDDSGGEVAPGADGRLWIKARSTMARYWNAPDATAEVLRDGWLDTGDLMRADADGFLWFRGRKKQLIIHDGSNIAPQEVEEALLAHPAIESAGVIGIHNLLHGESVRAYVTLRDGAGRPTAQALIAFARTRIAAYKCPEEVVFLDAMPLNATGKVDRVRLKHMAEDAPAPR